MASLGDTWLPSVTRGRYAWECSFCRCSTCAFCAPLSVASHAALGGGSHVGWHSLAANVTESHAVARQLSCPGGCEFRVQAMHLPGWAFASVSSTVASTPSLTPPPPGAARLQLRLHANAAHLAGSIPMVGSLLVRDVAMALGEEGELERYHLVEVRLAAEYVIFDILPPRTIGMGVDRVRQLLVAMVVDARSKLYAGEVGRAVDGTAGVSVLDDEGIARALPLPSLEVAKLTLLAEHSRKMSVREWAVALLVLAVVGLALWRWGSGVAAWRGGYSKGLPTAEEDETEAMVPTGGKRGGRRVGRVVSARDDDDEEEEEEEAEEEERALAAIDEKRGRRGRAPSANPFGTAPRPYAVAARRSPDGFFGGSDGEERDVAALVTAVADEAPLRMRATADANDALCLQVRPPAPPRLPPPPGSHSEQFERVMNRVEAMVGSGGELQRREVEEMVEAMRAMSAAGAAPGADRALMNGCGGDGEGDEEEIAWRQYEAALTSIASQLRAGTALVSRELYAERDDCLHRLSDAALQQEYVRQSEAYLDATNPPAVRAPLRACPSLLSHGH